MNGSDYIICLVATLGVAITGGGPFLLNCRERKITMTGDNLFGMAVLGYATPQVYLMFCVTNFNMDFGSAVYVIYLMMCNVGFHVGYVYAGGSSSDKSINVLNEDRFLIASYIAALVSFIGWVLWYQRAQQFEGRHWNSTLIYLYTLASQSRPAFTLAACGVAFCKKKQFAVIPLLITLVPLTHFVFMGRRSAIFYIGVNLVFLATYILRRRLPANLMLMLLPTAILAFLLVPVYRGPFSEGIDALEHAFEVKPVSEAVGDFLDGEKTIEYYHASRAMYASMRSHRYSYGAGFWNAIVFQYIPGGLIGRENKELLMIDEPDLKRMVYSEYQNASLYRSYLALGGYQNSFQQFSFGGCVLFALIAYGFRRVETSALINRDHSALVFLMLCGVVPAMLPYFSITRLNAMLFFPVVLYWIASKFIYVKAPITAGGIRQTDAPRKRLLET